MINARNMIVLVTSGNMPTNLPELKKGIPDRRLETGKEHISLAISAIFSVTYLATWIQVLEQQARLNAAKIYILLLS